MGGSRMPLATARRCWRGGSLACLLVALVTGLLVTLTTTGQHQHLKCAEKLDDPLTITSRADGGFPPDLTDAETEACLRRRQAALGRPTRIGFIGHSRARQVFEKLTARLQLRLLTRAEPGRRIRFVDRLLLPPWHHFADNDSTCMGVWPKGRAAGQPAAAWCSMVAVGPRVELEFRWRHSLDLFLDALMRAEAACAKDLSCPDVLVVGQGLHFMARGNFDHLMPVFRMHVEEAAAHLRRLAARGVRVLWLLEQPANPSTDVRSYNDDSLVLNALMVELLGGGRRAAGVRVWTSAASIVTQFWTRTCLGLMPKVDPEELHVCIHENYHVNNGTLSVMAGQLLRFVCEGNLT